jgi:spore maturation protein CgeB
MNVVILGLSITSSWGNGHATCFRGLVRELSRRGDEVLFLERDAPWYARHRDLPEPPWGRTRLYGSLEELDGHRAAVRAADLVILGSFVPEGVEVARWVLAHAGGASAFYDIDTPVTIGRLRAGQRDYLAAEAVARFDLYLSFTGGRALEILAGEFGARRPVFFPCFVDPDSHAPPQAQPRWSVNYLGTYAAGRQPALERTLLTLARRRPRERFSIAGPMYPQTADWPANVEHIEHLAPAEHPSYYASARLTLNLTRPEMKELGHAPSVRLFEAAACGAAIVSDRWAGLEEVLEPGEEILLADSAEELEAHLEALDEPGRAALAAAARRRVLREHTAARRAESLHRLLGGCAAGERGCA